LSKERFPVGKIVGVHGIRGEVKVLPYDDEGKKAWKVVYVHNKGTLFPLDVLGNRPHKGVLLFKLAGVNSRDEANELVGYEVFIKKEDLEPLHGGEHYYFELEGMEVETDVGRYLGVVKGILSTGCNDVYVVNGPDGEILLPAIKDVILNIDVESNKMKVHVLEGLLKE